MNIENAASAPCTPNSHAVIMVEALAPVKPITAISIRTARISLGVRAAETALDDSKVGMVDVFVLIQVFDPAARRGRNGGARHAVKEKLDIVVVHIPVLVEIGRMMAGAADGEIGLEEV